MKVSLSWLKNYIPVDYDADDLSARLTMAGLVVVCLLTAGLHRLADLAAWPRIALRAVASWIAAVSLILVALALQAPAQAG